MKSIPGGGNETMSWGQGLTHPEMGYHHYLEYVCREILGMGDEEFILLNEDVFQ